MIRINLLSEGKKPAVVRRKRSSLELGVQDLGQWCLIGALALAAIGCGIYFWMLRSEIKDYDRKIARAQREVEELRPIIKEVEDYKNKQAELEHKISVINDLKTNQRGPVRVMDEISRAIPELLWLNNLKMTPAKIELNGKAFNPNAVAAFTENLDRVPEFQNEPDFKQTSLDRSNRALYDFKIHLNYRLLPLSTPPGEAGEELLEEDDDSFAAGGA